VSPRLNSEVSHAGRYRIRPFESRDLPEIQEIARQSPEAAVWADQSYLRTDGERQFAWVRECQEGVGGFLVARVTAPDEAEVLNLAVSPARRRAGHATQLLQTCVSEFAKRGIGRVFLEVRESNLAAIAFYERQQFVRTGRRPGYYQNPPEAAVLLVRKLTG